MSTIAAGTTSTNALVQTADTTGTLVFQTNGTTNALNIDTSQNVNFVGTAQRLTGDFTNATQASRLSFVTSSTNSTTGIYALPSGTATAASWQATNANDPTNASKILIATNGSTDVQLVSGRNGSGTYLPLSFYTNGVQQAQIDTSGNLTVNNGGFVVGSPTGGTQGAGTINATGIYINGVALSTSTGISVAQAYFFAGF